MVFANGHLALDSACKALGLCSGEVITTPFTFLSTAHALSMNGLKPIFCDIKESDCTIDEEKLEALKEEYKEIAKRLEQLRKGVRKPGEELSTGKGRSVFGYGWSDFRV